MSEQLVTDVRHDSGLPNELVDWIEEITSARLTGAQRRPGGGRRQAWFVDVQPADGPPILGAARNFQLCGPAQHFNRASPEWAVGTVLFPSEHRRTIGDRPVGGHVIGQPDRGAHGLPAGRTAYDHEHR